MTFNPGRGDHWEEPIRRLGVPLVEVPQRRNKAARLRDFVKVLRHSEARIVHSWDFPLNASAALCARLAGVSVRVGGLRRNLFKPGRSGWRRWAGTTGLDRFVVNSTRGQSDLGRLGISADRIDLVFNAVEPPQAPLDATQRRQVRARWGAAGDDDLVIVNISNLIAVKNHLLLLDVTRRLVDRGLRVRTVIFGDGPLREELRRSTAERSLADRVAWMGRDPAAPQLLAAADVFGFTSRSEGCPNVLLEAAACSLPVVTTDVGGARDIVLDGETGYIVPNEDREALAARLEELLLDRERSRRMGATAFARVRREFAPRRSAAAVQSVYDRGVAARERSS